MTQQSHQRGRVAARRTVGRAVRGILSTTIDLVLPRTCPGCDAPEAWCASCAAMLSGPARRVRLGDAALDAAAGLPLPPVRALARYAGPVRAAILAGKEGDRRDLPSRLGEAVGRALLGLRAIDPPGGACWIVPAPSRAAAARTRGGDPVAAMAKVAASVIAATGQPAGVAQCLTTAGRAADSVGLDPGERLLNLHGRVRFRSRAAPPPGAAVVLLDDVVTTGATVVSALRELSRAGIGGVSTVLAVAAAAPWLES